MVNPFRALTQDEIWDALRPPPLKPMNYDRDEHSNELPGSSLPDVFPQQPDYLEGIWARVLPHVRSALRIATDASAPLLPRQDGTTHLPLVAADSNAAPSWYAGKRGFPPRPNPEFIPEFQRPRPGVGVCEPGGTCSDIQWQWNPTVPIFRIDPATGKIEFFTPDGPHRIEDTDRNNDRIPDSGQPPGRRYFVPGLIS